MGRRRSKTLGVTDSAARSRHHSWGHGVEAGVTLLDRVRASKFLYFSLATLTTLGYGDIVAVGPAGRMLAALEVAAGVLYIAITVARLVASYQTISREDQVG